MKNGETFLQNIDNIKQHEIILVGVKFYIQLFINYNLLQVKRLTILNKNKEVYWSDKIELVSVDRLPSDRSSMIVVFCGLESVRDKELMDYNFFDMKSIKKTGTFEYVSNTYIVDDVKFVASNPNYMKAAYPKIEENELANYLEELSLVPAGRCLSTSKEICLNDYNGRLVHHKNGKRVTYNNPQNYFASIHFFGDSRVSGYMLEDQDLFTNILQNKLLADHINYRVLNYGIPGREIDRIEYQIKKAKIMKNDIVFVMTACHEYREESIQKQYQFAIHMQNIKRICDEKNSKLCYINLPTVAEIRDKNEYERDIFALYKRYKFNEYSIEVLNYYKLFLFEKLMSYGIFIVDLVDKFNLNRKDLLFINMHHYSPKGNELIADALAEIIHSMTIECDYNNAVARCVESREHLFCWIANERKCRYARYKELFLDVGLNNKLNNLFVIKLALKDYIWNQRKLKKKIGAVVMNANPFTYGHKYLIERACKEVDMLYVFVLSEDKSDFSFEDRYNMVKIGTRCEKKVIVLPSGKSIISDITFPEYFMKQKLQDTKINAYKDIESFALQIARRYNIKYRFVGEEPMDKVTRQYNEQMKERLPLFNIECVEVPRCLVNNHVISATKVRKAYNDGKWNELEKMVPHTTLEYLKRLSKRN